MSPTNWVSGKRYTALSFSSAEDQFVDVGVDLATQLGSSSSLSVWIKTSTIGGIFPDAGITGSKNGIMWGWIDISGRICLSVHSVVIVTSTSPINNNEWHHVVLSRDSDTGLALVYVDGQLEGESYGPVGMITEAFSSLGKVKEGLGFDGTLDEILVLSVVVTSDTVKTLMLNHGPECWPVKTSGNNRDFTTPSIYTNCFDVERNNLSITSWTMPNQ